MTSREYTNLISACINLSILIGTSTFFGVWVESVTAGLFMFFYLLLTVKLS